MLGGDDEWIRERTDAFVRGKPDSSYCNYLFSDKLGAYVDGVLLGNGVREGRWNVKLPRNDPWVGCYMPHVLDRVGSAYRYAMKYVRWKDVNEVCECNLNENVGSGFVGKFTFDLERYRSVLEWWAYHTSTREDYQVLLSLVRSKFPFDVQQSFLIDRQDTKILESYGMNSAESMYLDELNKLAAVRGVSVLRNSSFLTMRDSGECMIADPGDDVDGFGCAAELQLLGARISFARNLCVDVGVFNGYNRDFVDVADGRVNSIAADLWNSISGDAFMMVGDGGDALPI